MASSVTVAPMSAATATYIGYAVGGLALLALASPAPRLATGIVLVLILGVIFSHGAQAAGALNSATAALQGVRQAQQQ